MHLCVCVCKREERSRERVRERDNQTQVYCIALCVARNIALLLIGCLERVCVYHVRVCVCLRAYECVCIFMSVRVPICVCMFLHIISFCVFMMCVFVSV
jgi:hypothetical protein